MSFKEFKDKLHGHLENVEYAQFFMEVDNNANITYEKATFARLKTDFIWENGRKREQHESLVIFVSTIQENRQLTNHTPPSPYTKAEIDALDFTHAFRPELTRNLMQRMAVHGQCFNLYGKKGMGKKRMLEDLAKCGLRDARFVLMDMKYHIENHARFLEKLAKECGIPKQSLGEMVNNVKEKAHLFLFLDNFEEIFKDNPKKDRTYNGDFFDELNGMKTAGQKLIIATQEKHTSHILDGRRSWLTVSESELPEHTYAQVAAEIKRKLPTITTEAQTYLAEQFEFRKYDLMNQVLNDIIDNEEDINAISFGKLKEIVGKLIRKYN